MKLWEEGQKDYAMITEVFVLKMSHFFSSFSLIDYPFKFKLFT